MFSLQQTGKPRQKQEVFQQHLGGPRHKQEVCWQHFGKPRQKQEVCHQHLGEPRQKQEVCLQQLGDPRQKRKVCLQYLHQPTKKTGSLPAALRWNQDKNREFACRACYLDNRPVPILQQNDKLAGGGGVVGDALPQSPPVILHHAPVQHHLQPACKDSSVQCSLWWYLCAQESPYVFHHI